MRNIRISLVRLPSSAHDIALSAAHEAFPRADIVESAKMDGIVGGETLHGLDLLVLSDANPDLISQATQAVDQAGLPRWAVVILGRDTSELAETVPPEEWNPWLLARVFRSALLQHELLRENFRMRGDLKTVARRFSHDLVTPVGCINTSACVLKVMPAEDTQSIAAIIQNIEDSSAEISQLIERVSFVVRASVDPGVPIALDTGEVVAAVLKQLKAEIEKVGATIITPPVWPKVSGISKWVNVIWWNLISNALKHGGTGVHVRIGWQPEGEGVLFSVTDNGTGVTPMIEPGLFRSFDQLHATQTAGLGLSIVQRLTLLQGGRCAYKSIAEGGGACFSFTLPSFKS